MRTAFGAQRTLIRTVFGRGYQFTGEIHVVPASPGEPVGAVAAHPASILPPTNVPGPVSELIGREEKLSEILKSRHHTLARHSDRRRRHRKTTLALALARELRPHFADAVWLAEFSASSIPGWSPPRWLPLSGRT